MDTLVREACVRDGDNPGAPMGLAPVAHALYSKIMKLDPTDPSWVSPGLLSFMYSSTATDSCLAMDMDALYCTSCFTCLVTRLPWTISRHSASSIACMVLVMMVITHSTPGHPENVLTPGIEVTTGPLGQGV